MILQRYHELSLRYNGNDVNAYVVEADYSVLGVFQTEARAVARFDMLKARMIQFAQPRKLEGGWTLSYRVRDESSMAFAGTPFRLHHPKHDFNAYGTEAETLKAHERFLQRLDPTRAVVVPPPPESADWSWVHVIGFVIAACGLALMGANL